ncbi:chitin synthase III catalytic subunit-domain-containing protein [Radiomyces spectabilis]|uniref:chitin synthase III catalytic subunit-domain-containing protein n=1 Tax=Radiomyces spectabilis TaxID=64574 RepID=UPI00221FB253|nr:chitin synthase III catalytic subunit-domain-containing protein [Radiomyces spectabilis]KAI8388239.1 chitin synthase III catalytic subunit-domain-containing protein [Radiomyces spectabilis]
MALVDKLPKRRLLIVVLCVVFFLTIASLLSTVYPSTSKYDDLLSVAPASNEPAPASDEAVEEAEKVDINTEPTKADEWIPKNFDPPSKEMLDAINRNVKVSKRDRVLLTAVVNSGMADYTLNWIESLKRTKLDDKFLVFAIDDGLVDIMTKHGYKDHVVAIPPDWFHKEVSEEFQGWLEGTYTPITHSKSLVVERLLYWDVTVWFSDVDIVLTSPAIYDYLITKLDARSVGKKSQRRYITEALFTQEVEEKLINSGFYIMRPTDTNKRLLADSITISDNEPNVTQQQAMNRLLDDLDLGFRTSAIALLDLALFPHGRLFFEQHVPTKYGLEPMMVHANWRRGDDKRKALQAANLCFDGICQTVALSLCPLIGKYDGIEPVCYSRNVDLAGNLIFQPATLIIDIVAIIMTAIMIYHIRSKYTAVGRKEIVMFFYLYMVTVFLEMLLITGIIPTSSPVYPWFTAVHIGLISATFWCLLLNGFVGFQFAEDGTPLSLWSIRISSFVLFILVGFIAIATFQQIGPFSYSSPGALWVFYFIINGIAFIIYVISQIILVVNTLDDRWPLGDILFGTAFFIIGQVLMYVFSVVICDQVKHYVDGMFFGTICTLLAVMMVYKYWDSITKEDLEFSVGSKQNVWEVKELLGEDELGQNYSAPYSGQTMPHQPQYGQQYQQYEHPY